MIFILIEKVLNKLAKLQVNKAPGVDDIPGVNSKNIS